MEFQSEQNCVTGMKKSLSSKNANAHSLCWGFFTYVQVLQETASALKLSIMKKIKPYV